MVRSNTAHWPYGTLKAGVLQMKSFFELLGKAMESTGMTLRLCLLIAVVASAYYFIQVR